jgi:hypothetical protein
MFTEDAVFDEWELVARDDGWLIRRQTIGVVGKVRFAEGAAA